MYQSEYSEVAYRQGIQNSFAEALKKGKAHERNQLILGIMKAPIALKTQDWDQAARRYAQHFDFLKKHVSVQSADMLKRKQFLVELESVLSENNLHRVIEKINQGIKKFSSVSNRFATYLEELRRAIEEYLRLETEMGKITPAHAQAPRMGV